MLHDAFSHIPVAQKYNVPTFGSEIDTTPSSDPTFNLRYAVDADQSSVAPDIIITSTYWNWGPMLLRFVDLLLEDRFPGDFIYWGIREVLLDQIEIPKSLYTQQVFYNRTPLVLRQLRM